MIIFVLILGILSFYKIRIRKDDSFLDSSDTLAINGIFIMLVFFSHCEQYLYLPDSILNTLYLKFRDIHNQLIVTSFLTFSGYGIMRQALAKGETYFKTFPRNRILKVIINFDIAVLVYYILLLLTKEQFGLLHILLSFIGYTSIGNSSWYIFAIVIIYVIVYVSYLVFKNNYYKIASLITVGTIMYIIVLEYILKQEQWYFSTIMCFPFGVWIALFKDKIRVIISKKIFIMMISCLLGFVATYKFRYNPWIMNIHSIMFMALVIILLTKIKIGNKFLQYLGKNLFSIFILQRIPMIILSYFDLFTTNMYMIFVFVALIATFILSYLYNRYVPKIVDKIIQ